ncbi:MAG: hypothetical protein JRG71_05910 [Deltaproteobacteria bacterium]|nr:hypothetical protein [Deltaproteobacteria bacterium]
MTEDEIPRIEQTSEPLPINQATLDIIVANVIPSSKYFEARFDHLEHRVIRIENEMKDFRSDMDNRFKEMRLETNERFDDMKRETKERFSEMKRDTDKRFEQVDKRFEQVDMRLGQIVNSIDRLSDNLDRRDNVQRAFTMKMFSISIMISFIGVLGVALKLFDV